MFSKNVKSRILFLITALIIATVIIFVILKSLEENVVYFFSPTEIYNKTNISLDKKIRIGGLVKNNSVEKKGTSVNFVITDLNKEIAVTYTGIIPNLFSEGKGVVAEGKLEDRKFFIAEKILAKHDENYMPPEVREALKDK